MPLPVLGATTVTPPQIPCEPANSREIAAILCMPGVCGVLESNCWGLIIRTVGFCSASLLIMYAPLCCTLPSPMHNIISVMVVTMHSPAPGYPQGVPLPWTNEPARSALVHGRGTPCGYPGAGWCPIPCWYPGAGAPNGVA